jgi:hypothetical protein
MLRCREVLQYAGLVCEKHDGVQRHLSPSLKEVSASTGLEDDRGPMLLSHDT